MALESVDIGKLAFLGLDVFPEEPYPELKCGKSTKCLVHTSCRWIPSKVRCTNTVWIAQHVSRWCNGDSIPYVVEESS